MLPCKINVSLISHVSYYNHAKTEVALLRHSSGVEMLDIRHPRPVGLAIASSLGAGLSVAYRSIHKYHALLRRFWLLFRILVCILVGMVKTLSHIIVSTILRFV